MTRKQTARSLDRSAERLNGALDLLVEAAHSLRLRSDLDDALAQIANAFVSSFVEHCSIELDIDGTDRPKFRVTAGTLPSEPIDERGVIVEPLSDGRRTLGTITCRTSAPEGFDPVVRQAIRLFAIQLATVVTGHAVTARERRVANRLQRALLPEELPAISGAQFHASYRPASDEAEVGGDWFDAFNLTDGRIAISVGDVAGHGLDAAVIMGEVRQIIRTAAVAFATPAEVLEHVNRVATLRESIGFVTAIFGTYDPVASTLSYAVAGHPPPILALANGLVRNLPGGGVPLGCAPSLESKDWTVSLPEEAHAVFYTDGLIENEHDPIAGEKRLLDIVRRLTARAEDALSRPTDLATAVLDGVFGEAPNRDDAAVLSLSRDAPVTGYVFSAVPVAAPIARAIVEDQMAALGIAAEQRFGVLVALGEAMANAVDHGYRGETPGLIRLGFENEARELVITVEDFGRWRPFVRSDDERGRGIKLMHALMDSVQIRSTRESTRITLKAELTD